MSGKIIYDIIHGYIKISPLCIKIIDTIEYQRLRNLKQLGLTYLIFPSAHHTRFEHSLGVSFLAGEMLKHLRENQPELNITDREIELIHIAGLCHDLGHGPFCHFFDNFILKDIGSNIEHEIRSCMLLKYIVEKYSINISEKELDIIFNMINPSDSFLKKDRSFLYKIVNNKANGIDVDKFDYIKRDSFFLGMSFGLDCSRIIKQARVIDDEICFLDKTFYDIQELYEVRDKLHRRVYKHHTNHAIDFMIYRFFKDLMKNINFKDYVEHPEKFYILDDNLIWRFQHNILDRIRERKFYKHIEDVEIDKCKDKINKIINNDKVIITELNFGYDKEIFKNIFFYKDNKKFTKNFNICEKEKIIRIIDYS